MKIQIVDASTKKPLPNMSIKLQVQGKDAGYVNVTTDSSGNLELDNKYKGQQILTTINGAQSPLITATDGAVLSVKGRTSTSASSSEASTTTTAK